MSGANDAKKSGIFQKIKEEAITSAGKMGGPKAAEHQKAALEALYNHGDIATALKEGIKVNADIYVKTVGSHLGAAAEEHTKASLKNYTNGNILEAIKESFISNMEAVKHIFGGNDVAKPESSSTQQTPAQKTNNAKQPTK